MIHVETSYIFNIQIRNLINSVIISSSRHEQVCLVELRLERDGRSISENIASLPFFQNNDFLGGL